MLLYEEIELIVGTSTITDEEQHDFWHETTSLIMRIEHHEKLTPEEINFLESAESASSIEKRRRNLSYLASLLKNRMTAPDCP